MLPERRRQLAVVALVVLLGAVAWNYFGGSGPTAPALPAATGPRRPAARGPSDALPPAESVRLAALPRERGEPDAATRNPFRFGQARAAGGTAKPIEAPVFAPPPVAPTVPSGPAPPPPIPLKFIGIVEKGNGQKWAVLTAGDGRGPVHGKEGDIIDGRYRILKIGDESIDIVYVDGRGKQTIRLTGQ